MNASWLSPLSGTASALANHLWQSTVFALGVWLITLLLRNNQARIRHALWLTASLKFLVPFSLLITLGSLVPQPTRVASVTPQTIYSTIDFAAQPFAPWQRSPVANHSPTQTDILTSHLPTILAVLWITGVLTVLLSWFTGWRRLGITHRYATPAYAGRVHDLLRRVEVSTDMRSPLLLRLSFELIEPGIFGVFRPELVWPERLTERLGDEHIEAIIMHELMHAQHRDNLTAALHMLIEAAFWFHPFVWWIGRHLIDERERACDEAVIELGGQPDSYAESLLKACRFCIESPLPCVSGITGAELSDRIRCILNAALAAKLTRTRKVLLAAAAIGSLAAPFAIGQIGAMSNSVLMARFVQPQPLLAPPAPPAAPAQRAEHRAGPPLTFEVASIRQNRTEISPSKPPHTNFSVGGDAANGGYFNATNLPVFYYLQFAYKDLSPTQLHALLKQLPDWASENRFDIQARAGGDPSKDEMRAMMQALLASRFGLKMHFETQQVPIYALVVVAPGKLGPKLRPHSAGEPCTVSSLLPRDSKVGSSPTWPPKCGMFMGHMTTEGMFEVGSRDATMDQLSGSISAFTGELDRTVVNYTGLQGTFDDTLQWTPEPGSPFVPQNASVAPGAQSTSLAEALSEQLGLKLIRTSVAMPIPHIDHIDRPSVN